MFGREENAYNRKKYRYKAHYSLDFHEAVEHGILFSVRSPEEIYERKLTCEQLHQAMATLPDKQAKRIYAHYFLGMSKTDIARAEKVSESAVCGVAKHMLHPAKKFNSVFFGESQPRGRIGKALYFRLCFLLSSQKTTQKQVFRILFFYVYVL